jgi:chemotaxis signal transduction protein
MGITQIYDTINGLLAEANFSILDFNNDKYTQEQLIEIRDCIENIIYEYKIDENNFIGIDELNRSALDILNEIIDRPENLEIETPPFLTIWHNINEKYLHGRVKDNKELSNLELQNLTKPFDEFVSTQIKNINNNLNLNENKEVEENKDILKVLLFEINNVIYGLKSTNIVEIKMLAVEGITNAYNVSDSVIGLYNLRGEVISLIDLRIFLDVKKKNEIDYLDPEKNMIISVKYENRITGLIVDKTVDFKDIAEKDVIHNTNFKDIKKEYVQGVVNDPDYNFVVLLNIEKFLDKDSILEKFLIY